MIYFQLALQAHGEVKYIDLIDGDKTATVRCDKAEDAAEIIKAKIQGHKCRKLKGMCQ